MHISLKDSLYNPNLSNTDVASCPERNLYMCEICMFIYQFVYVYWCICTYTYLHISLKDLFYDPNLSNTDAASWPDKYLQIIIYSHDLYMYTNTFI